MSFPAALETRCNYEKLVLVYVHGQTPSLDDRLLIPHVNPPLTPMCGCEVNI